MHLGWLWIQVVRLLVHFFQNLPRLNSHQFLIFFSPGNIFVSDKSVIWKYAAGTTTQTKLMGTTGQDNSAAGNPFVNGLRKTRVDSSNNLWIVNYKVNQVYLIPLSTGILSTFAGIAACNPATCSPSCTYCTTTNVVSGDGGKATSATMVALEDVQVDVSGVLSLLLISFIP